MVKKFHGSEIENFRESKAGQFSRVKIWRNKEKRKITNKAF